MAVEVAIGVVAALLGAAFGSFLNVCIARLPRNESIVSPRSRCMACGHTVRWFDNVPVLSYLLLRGRCRDCRTSFSPRYLAVEAGLALWWVLSFLPAARLLAAQGVDVDVLLGSFAHATGIAVFGFFLLGLAAMDWRHGILPNEFTLGGLAAGLFFAFLESFFLPSVRYKTFLTPEEVFIFRRVGAALAGWLLLWGIGALYGLVRGRSGLGGGDPKMLAMMGAFLGWQSTALALFVAVGLAAAVGLVLVAARRASGTTRLPFGVALAAGGIVAAVAGPPILAWYASLFG